MRNGEKDSYLFVASCKVLCDWSRLFACAFSFSVSFSFSLHLCLSPPLLTLGSYAVVSGHVYVVIFFNCVRLSSSRLVMARLRGLFKTDVACALGRSGVFLRFRMYFFRQVRHQHLFLLTLECQCWSLTGNGVTQKVTARMKERHRSFRTHRCLTATLDHLT